MTLFDFGRFSEIKDPGWNVNTLKPPLKFKEILLDLKIQWKSYCYKNLSFIKKIKFLYLRIFQRIAYNLGWLISTRNYYKMIKSGGSEINGI